MTTEKKRQAISKADSASGEGVHQLTDIQVHEVSVVDRAANKKRFVTVKADGSPEETAARIQAVDDVSKAKKDDNAEDTSGEVPSQIPIAHAQAASAHAQAASAHAAAAQACADGTSKKKTSKASDVAPLPPPASAVSAAPAAVSVETVANPEEELLALAKSSGAAATAETTKAAEIAVQPNADGSITITVDDQPTTISNPSLPATVQDKVKTSVVAGIDAIMLRMATLRMNVLNSKGSYSASGTPSELSDLYYICDMLYSLYSIGGPNWEIEQAADAALDANGVTKSIAKSDSVKVQKNKVITMARTLKLNAAHKAMEYAHKDMDGVLKELDSEGGDATGEMARGAAAVAATPADTAPSNFAKAAEKDIKETPEYLALVSELKTRDEELKKRDNTISALQKTVEDQGSVIAKARGIVAPSNSVEQIGVVKAADDEVEWPLDLAASRKPINKNFGRDNERARRR